MFWCGLDFKRYQDIVFDAGEKLIWNRSLFGQCYVQLL